MRSMSTPKLPPAARASGFTLIEIMIVVLIASMLLALAASMYQTSVQHGRRVDAKSAVIDLAGREERYYAATNAYTTDPSQLGYVAAGTVGATFPQVVGSGYYQVSVGPGAATIATSYVASAVPTAGSSQLKDLQCQYFSVDNTGKQFSSATGAGGADTSSTCWQ